MSVADNISFNNFCQLCKKISEAAHDKKAEVFQTYIENWKKKGRELKASQPNTDDSFYPVLRFLLPQLDRERGAYGVKEHTLAKIYIRILSLPKDGKDAIKFLEYRAPKTSGSEAGDFAEVAYWVLKKRCAAGCQLSIEEVNNHLDEIAAKHASNEPRGVDSELISLLKATSAEEQKWLIRILLKEMKMGFSQNGILRAYHPDARELYDASNNLRKICEVLKNPELRLHEIEIELFLPVKPMLSEEFEIQKLDAYLKKSKYFYVETKLDGERFQLHMKEGDFKYFSRNGYDYTFNFGETCHKGILTPRIAASFRSDIKSCILDGEMMSWNLNTKSFASKASHLDVKNLRDNCNYQPCFCVFDVLFYNGNILTNKPLNYRLDILNEIIKPIEGTICFVSRKRISKKDEVIDSLNEAIDNREEGIVMKEFLSVYKPNVRKNGGWYKIKPEYIGGLSDTLDLLIIGGYFGSGRRSGNISHFLLGVAVNVNDNSKLFYSVARVGSGYSMEELAELQNKLQPYWKRTKIDEMPLCLEWTKEKPDVWIEPDRSFILEVKAAEITESLLFRTEYTLRFPRVEKVRYDKSWKDCLTFEEFEEKRKMASGKLAYHHVLPMEDECVVPKKKPALTNIALGSQFKGVDISNIELVSNLLDGKEICVFTGFGKVSKNEVERKIIEFGGTLVQNPGNSTVCILAESDATVRIKNVIRCGTYDLIRTSWFYSQLTSENSQLPEFKPSNYLTMSEQARKVFSKFYDEFGDHYTMFATRESLEYSMDVAKSKLKDFVLSAEDKYNMDIELFSGPSPYSIFRLCVAYFDSFSFLEDSNSEVLLNLKLTQIDFRLYGGQCSDLLTDNVTHVVIFSRDLSRLEEINRRNADRKKKYRVVTEKWIQGSIKNKLLLEHDCI